MNLSGQVRWPLMRNNITRADLDAAIAFLSQDDPILTHSVNVRAFEREWSEWLGVRYSVFVNSGASANLLTMAALRERFGTGEVIVSPLNWVSDIAATLHCGFAPVFADIDPRTLGMDNRRIVELLSKDTRAVLLTHILGYNALSRELLNTLAERGIPLIEDVCESHGAEFEGRKLGTFGLLSDFSFYYAHHMSTIEGGMVCTDDPDLYETVRMLRSHGMVREAVSDEVKRTWNESHPDLNPEFIFAFPGYNVRPNEINAVIGRSQLGRLDLNNRKRRENLRLFLDTLDGDKYRTDFAVEGSCNYAFTLVLREPDLVLCEQVMESLHREGIEFRRGLSGGGNQLRQPYLKRLYGEYKKERFRQVDHVHSYGFYIGNYPDLDPGEILSLCSILNSLEGSRAYGGGKGAGE
jgi:CDP-4-dehydro-6-deoxyglucose reductase, E1